MPHKDPDARRAYMRAYKKRHPEKFSRDYDRVVHANQRAAQAGVAGRLTIADVRAVKAVGRCFYCGRTRGLGRIQDLGIDHKVSMSLGGPNTRSNLVACCHQCNVRKQRAERPSSWSTSHEACVDCGTTERHHVARGRCNACYLRAFGSNRKAVAVSGH